MVPVKSRGAALLQLTGDVDFNVDIRKRAQAMGMQLNEYGLWRFRPQSGSSRMTPHGTATASEEDGHWELVASETEEEILDQLNMPWVEPEKRNFSFLMADTGKRHATKQRRKKYI